MSACRGSSVGSEPWENVGMKPHIARQGLRGQLSGSDQQPTLAVLPCTTCCEGLKIVALSTTASRAARVSPGRGTTQVGS